MVGKDNEMSSLKYVLAVALIAVTGTLVVCQDKPKNEVEIRATVSVPSGEANFSGTGAAGSTIDFNRDFDFKNEWGFEIKYAYRSENGKHKFAFDYANTDWDRTRTITRSFTFRGETYVIGASVEANLRQSVWRGMYSYRWGNDKIRIGPMVDMGVIPTRLDLTGTTLSGTGRKTEGSISKFAATVGYDLDYDPTSKVSLFNNLGVIAFRHDRLFHAEGGIKYFPAHNFGAVAGYKFQRYRWVDDENFFKVTSHAPFVGGVVRW